MGLLSEGFLRLRFGGLFSEGFIYLFIYLFIIYLFIYLFIFFLGGGGGGGGEGLLKEFYGSPS